MPIYGCRPWKFICYKSSRPVSFCECIPLWLRAQRDYQNHSFLVQSQSCSKFFFFLVEEKSSGRNFCVCFALFYETDTWEYNPGTCLSACFIKGGPEHLKNEIKEKGSKRDDQFSDHCFDLVKNMYPYILRQLNHACNAKSRINFVGEKCLHSPNFPRKNLKSWKTQSLGNLFCYAHFLVLWSGCSNPPNIWTALFQKETQEERPPKLK